MSKTLLSPTQSNVLREIAKGMTRPQVAARLNMSRSTVRTHMSDVFERLGATNGPHAVALGIASGIVPLPEALRTDNRPRIDPRMPKEPGPLSQRELEVLSLVAKGYSNKLIAARLGISERTVKSHLSYIMTKLRAFDRTHAVVIALRLGWIRI